MKMAIKDGQVILVDVGTDNYMTIKGWGLMRWDKRQQALYGPATADLLNHLADLLRGRLPAPAEALRQQLNNIEGAVDAQRMDPEPKPLYKFPVKLPLYRHQIRGANMALMVFGLVDPPEGGEEHGNP